MEGVVHEPLGEVEDDEAYDDLWEITCDPQSNLSSAYENVGRNIFRVSIETGWDLSKPDVLERFKKMQQK